MKTYAVSLSLLTATLFAAVALSQGTPPAQPLPAPSGEVHPFRDEMLKRFDANHDGKLDESERAAARQAWQQRMAGSRGPEHQAGPAGGCQCCRPPMRGMQALLQAHPGMRAKLFERFDADHDGKLSDTERAAARQAVQERFKQAGPHRQEVMARFDANQDGTLNETERASARSAWQEFLKQHPVIKPTVPATGT